MSVKIGLIGAGFVTSFAHVPALKRVRNVELIGIYDPNQISAQTRIQQAVGLGVGNPILFNSVGDLARACDAVIIAVPNQFRLPVMREIAEAKGSGAQVQMVAVEKPLARTNEEGQEMVALAQNAHLNTFYLECLLFADIINDPRRLLAAGQEIGGRPFIASSSEKHSGPHAAGFWLPSAGGGAMLDMGCHAISVAKWLLTPMGKPYDYLQPMTVSSEMDVLKWAKPEFSEQVRTRFGVDFMKAPLEDWASATVKFLDPETRQVLRALVNVSWCYDSDTLMHDFAVEGPLATYEARTGATQARLFFHPELAQRAGKAIVGREAAGEKTLTETGIIPVHLDQVAQYGYVNQMQSLVDACAAGKNGDIHFANAGLETLQIMMAAYHSAEQGREVRLDEVPAGFVPMFAQGKGNEFLAQQRARLGLK